MLLDGMSQACPVEPKLSPRFQQHTNQWIEGQVHNLQFYNLAKSGDSVFI